MTNSKRVVSGVVRWNDDKKNPISGVKLCAIRDKQVITCISNKAGVFAFAELSSKCAWSITGSHFNAVTPDPIPIEFNVDEEAETRIELLLNRTSETRSRKLGAFVLIACIGLLAFLINSYWNSHEKATEEFDQNSILSIIGESEELLTTLLAKKPKAFDNFDQDMKSVITKLSKYKYQDFFDNKITLNQSIEKLYKRSFEINVSADKQLTDAEKQAIRAEVNEVKQALIALKPSYFWTKLPWLFLELWCWALMGLLIQKIMRIGWYLRSNQYYSDGTWMHFAHLVAVPVLGVIGTLLLSMVQFKTTTGIVVDFSNPQAMVMIAFLLCIYPWKLYDFVRSKSAAILNSELGDKQ